MILKAWIIKFRLSAAAGRSSAEAGHEVDNTGDQSVYIQSV